MSVDNDKNSSVEINQIIEEARQEVKRRINEIEEKAENKEEERKKFGEELKREINESLVYAEEVVVDELESQARRSDFKKKKERDFVFFNFLKVIEAVNQGILTDYITENKQGGAFLNSLAKGSFTPSTASFILNYFGDFIFGEENIIDPNSQKINEEFRKRFEEVKTFNFFAAKQVREALIDSAEKRTIPGLTKEMIEKELTLLKERKQAGLSEEEKKIFFKLFKLINEKLQEALKEKKIDLNEVVLINNFLFTGEITEEFIRIAFKIGLTEENIKKYSELFNIIKHEEINFGFLENYSPTWMEYIYKAQKEFAIDELLKYFKRDEKGFFYISKKDKLILKDKIRKYYYIALKTIHEQSSEQFHKVMGEHQDISYYIMMLRQVIHHSFDKLKEMIVDVEENQDIISFINDLSGNYQSRIYTYAEIFHDIPLLARDLSSVEKILDFLRYIFPTQLAELFDDENIYLTIARDEAVMLLRQYLVERNNQYDGSLLSGEYNKKGAYWQRWFKEKYLARLKKRIRNVITSDSEREFFEENLWKVDMLATYAEAIGIATLIDGEVLATSDPVSHFRNVHPLMSLLSAKHNWSTGRGRDAPGLINRYFLGMKVDLYPQKRSLLARLFSKRKFDPEEIRNEIDNLIDIKMGNIFKDYLFSISASYYQLLSLFNLPNSYNSWDGWRIQEIPRDFNKIVVEIFGESMDIFKNSENFTSEDWQKIFDLGFKLYGTSFLWWSIKGDLGRLGKEIGKRMKNMGFSEEEIKFIKQKNVNDKIIRAIIGGREVKITYLEFEHLKLHQRRGELFFRYLRKNPGDFLMILNQLCPEVFSHDDKSDWNNTFLFRFSPNESEKSIIETLKKEGKSSKEIDSFIKRRRIFLEKWKNSFYQLKNINSWIKKVSKEERFLDKKGNFDKNKFINDFVEASANAYFRLKRENESIREKILYSDIDSEEKRSLMINLRDYLTEKDFIGEDEKYFWNLIAGKDGFLESITGLGFDNIDNYFSKFGGVDNEGEMSIFFDMANNWFLNNGDINPFSADTPYFEVFKNFKYTGEDTLKRTFEANISTFKEVVSQLGKLEKILLNTAKTGNLDEIKKLHTQIYDTLSGLVSNEYAWRANYVLAQIVANFFAEHSLARSPAITWLGPLGWLFKAGMGSKISLSKLLTKDIHAYTMDNNALRTYFEFLKRNNLINIEEDGPWGIGQLNRIFETSNVEIFFGDVTPRIVWTLSILILLLYLKKAMEEAFEKKK